MVAKSGVAKAVPTHDDDSAMDTGTRVSGAKRGAESQSSAGTMVAQAPKKITRFIQGATQEFRDNITLVMASPELTKELKVLQHVMDQVTAAVGELQQVSQDHETKITRSKQRHDGTDLRVGSTEQDITKLASDLKSDKQDMLDQVQQINQDYTRWEQANKERGEKLHTLLATQESLLNDRIKEIKELFVKADNVFVHASPAGPKTTGAPATTSVAGAQLPLVYPDVHLRAITEGKKATDLVRGSVDALQIEVNQLRAEVLDCQDLRVPIELSLQEQSNRTESFQTWAVTEVMDIRKQHQELTKHAVDAVEELRTEVKASACPCPPGCPGKLGEKSEKHGPSRKDPWHTYSGTTKPELRLPPGAVGKGPGSDKPDDPDDGPDDQGDGAGQGGAGGGRGQSNGGGGPGRGGGGPGRGGPNGGGTSPDSFHIYSEPDEQQKDFKRITRFTKSPFDCKSSSDVPKYNGRDKLAMWRRRASNFLHSRCCDMNKLLRWAEKQTEPITNDVLKRVGTMMDGVVHDAPGVSYHLWGWLSQNLVDDAEEIFMSVPDEDGVEVWRMLTADTMQKTKAEIMALDDQVVNPPRLTHVGQIPQALIKWDTCYREYMDAGGTAMTDEKKVGSLMRMIPEDVRGRIDWDHPQFMESSDVLRKWLLAKSKQLTRGSYAPQKRNVHILNDPDADPELIEELHALPEMPREQLFAYVRKFYQRKAAKPAADGPRTERQSPGPPRAPPREAPPRDARDVRCGNCGEKGHTSRDCKKPHVDMKDRGCFLCGKTGHQARNCPEKNGHVKSLDQPKEPEGDTFLGCLSIATGFTPVHHRKNGTIAAARRQAAFDAANQGGMEALAKPRGCTLGDCLSKCSVFAQLARLEANEKDGSDPESEEPGASSLMSQPKAKLLEGVTDVAQVKTLEGRDTQQATDKKVEDPKNIREDLTEWPSIQESHGKTKNKQRLEIIVDDEYELVESDDEMPVMADSSDDEDEGVKVKRHDYEDEAEDSDSDEDMDSFIKAISKTAAKQARESKRSLMSTAARGSPTQVINLFSPVEMLNSLPAVEPEYLEIEFTLDTGASVHAMDQIDLPGFIIEESAGSRAGQKFQAAGGKLIDNEGQVKLAMMAPGHDREITCMVQIAKVTRPLLSVTKMTESGNIKVVCEKEEARILDKTGKTLATFKRSGGLYTAVMRVKNPKFQPFTRPAR